MKITIKTLTLRNFKGIKSLTVPFTHETNIFGENASGKTTVFDAFLWLFFGKDSTDRKDFNIKTLDKNNRAISKLQHEVSAAIDVDGQEIELKRIFKEKWVTKRGDNTAEFSGHETEFFYNDVPFLQAEYKAKIDAILKEDIFKLITNSLYFNSIKWQDRRNVLMQIAGDVTDQDVVDAIGKNSADYDNLLMVLRSGKTLAEYKSQLAAKKKTIKDQLILIPSRIDEVSRAIPETVDHKALEKQIDGINTQIAGIDNSIANKTSAYKQQFEAIQAKQSELHELKTQQNNISFTLRNEIQQAAGNVTLTRNNFNNQIRNIDLEIISKNNQVSAATIRKTNLTQQLEKLRAQWIDTNKKELVFDDHDFSCPTCKREFEADNIEAKKEEMLDNFNSDKRRQLEQNQAEGKQLKVDLDQLDVTINKLNDEIAELNTSLTSIKEKLTQWEGTIATAVDPQAKLDEALANDDNYVTIGAQIAKLEIAVREVPAIDDTILKEQKLALQVELDSLKRQLSVKDQIERAQKRIDELTTEEKTMAQEIATLEQTEFLIEDFTKSKMNIIESRINGKFKYVKFKMFEQQINGGEVECCETLIGGVPFSDANNAARINAGLDIINALCDHYQVWAPIFIDNRESVSELIHCESQIINLVVVKGAKLSVNEIAYNAGQLAVA